MRRFFVFTLRAFHYHAISKRSRILFYLPSLHLDIKSYKLCHA